MKKKKMLIIGAGRMAEAIIAGIQSHANNFFAGLVVANKKDESRLNYLSEKYSIEPTSDWKAKIDDTDIVLLAVPPSENEAILRFLSTARKKDLFILTVAAGIDVSYMSSIVGSEKYSLCWFMPNTASQVGASMTIYCCNEKVTEEQQESLEMILGAIGSYEKRTEQEIHVLTAITGSGPAFFYQYAQSMIHSAIEKGLEEHEARHLVVKTIEGALKMIETGESIELLTAQVASPNGSTAEGLSFLENKNLQELLSKAVELTNAHARKNH